MDEEIYAFLKLNGPMAVNRLLLQFARKKPEAETIIARLVENGYAEIREHLIAVTGKEYMPVN